MSVLRSIEHRIESLFEGVFARAFRSHVHPAEIARKLAKEMDEHKAVSVSRIYAPNEYHLYLSPADREQFASYEDSLLTEFSDYLAQHARREGYALLSTPQVVLHEDDDLELGEFGIATRMAERREGVPSDEPVRVAAAAPSEIGATRIYRREETERAHATEERREARAAALVVGRTRHELAKPNVVVGRSRECDVTIGDANVSRRHAEIRREDGGYAIVDLGSTNGVEVNGGRVERARLEHGDRIVLGKTELTFEQS